MPFKKKQHYGFVVPGAHYGFVVPGAHYGFVAGYVR